MLRQTHPRQVTGPHGSNAHIKLTLISMANLTSTIQFCLFQFHKSQTHCMHVTAVHNNLFLTKPLQFHLKVLPTG